MDKNYVWVVYIESHDKEGWLVRDLIGVFSNRDRARKAKNQVKYSGLLSPNKIKIEKEYFNSFPGWF
jgi:hypothetical protein